MTAPSPESRLGQLLDDHIELTGIIGVGAYGVVYTARDLNTNMPYAVKALNKLGLDPTQRRFQIREINLHARAQVHPNVVSLVEILDAPDCVYVVMEYCEEGDLFAAITERGHYVGDDVMAKSIFLQVLAALEFCHTNGIYHRDLKPENVLVTNHGMHIKLGDFGLATTEPYTADFGCGSTFYMSPECQSTGDRTYAFYSSAANDIWSLGVILINLTCGRNPWKRACAKNDETYRAYLEDPNFLQSILPITSELATILSAIFNPDPTSRIDIRTLRKAIIACPRFTLFDIPDSEESEVVEELSDSFITNDSDIVPQSFSSHLPFPLDACPVTHPTRPYTPSPNTDTWQPLTPPRYHQHICPPTPDSPSLSDRTPKHKTEPIQSFTGGEPITPKDSPRARFDPVPSLRVH